jgi:hypothetical protein
VVRRTNNRRAKPLNTSFPYYSAFVAILLKHAPLLRHSATVKVISEAIDAAREKLASSAATCAAPAPYLANVLQTRTGIRKQL